jgi:hypothetical protein
MSTVVLQNSTFERGTSFFQLSAKQVDISGMDVSNIGQFNLADNDYLKGYLGPFNPKTLYSHPIIELLHFQKSENSYDLSTTSQVVSQTNVRNS